MTKIEEYVQQDKTRAGEQRLLTGIDWMKNHRELVDTDEDFHPAANGDPHWTESSFWAFTHAETAIGGWVYLRARPNLGLVQCGVYFFDAVRNDPWDALYNAEFPHVALPQGQSYMDLRLENGLSIQCLEPFARHHIAYNDVDIALEVEMTSVLPPTPAGLGDSTGHLDQPMWANGTLTLGDRSVELDDPAFRDRTWSDRSDYGSVGPNYYIWGTTQDRRQTLHATAGVLFGGHVHLDTQTQPVERVERTVVKRSADGRPEIIDALITCTDGSTSELHGTVLSAFPLMQPMPRTVCWISVVSWDCDGLVLIGEDHECWSFEQMRANRIAHGDPWAVHL